VAGARERCEEAAAIGRIDAAAHETVALEAGNEMGEPARGQDGTLGELGHAQSAFGCVEQRDQHLELLDRDPVSSQERLVERTQHGGGKQQGAPPRADLRVGQVFVW